MNMKFKESMKTLFVEGFSEKFDQLVQCQQSDLTNRHFVIQNGRYNI